MAPKLCAHLAPLAAQLAKQKVAMTSLGKAWSENCRHWFLVNAVLDCDALRASLAPCVSITENDDVRSGPERGLYCTVHHDAIVGLHPRFAPKRARVIGKAARRR